MAKKIKNKSSEKTKIDIEAIRSIISDKEILDPEKDREKIKEIKNDIYKNPISMAVLYSKCFSILEMNLSQFKSDEQDFSEALSNELESLRIDQLISNIKEYSFGDNFGDAMIEEKIKLLTERNREKCIRLINLFFLIFGEEE